MEDLKMLENLTLLYAEDDKVISESTKAIFELFFKEVIWVENGALALEIFNTKPIHMVVLDIKMPILNGLEVAKEIREVDLDIPIFITTSFVETTALLDAVKLNLIDYIVKPIEFAKLKEALITSIKRLQKDGFFYKKIDENINYNQLSKTLTKENSEIKLTKKEAKLMELFLKYRGKLMEKSFLEDEIFGNEVTEKSLKSLIYNLRKKVGIDKIMNIKDSGYLLKK